MEKLVEEKQTQLIIVKQGILQMRSVITITVEQLNQIQEHQNQIVMIIMVVQANQSQIISQQVAVEIHLDQKIIHRQGHQLSQHKDQLEVPSQVRHQERKVEAEKVGNVCLLIKMKRVSSIFSGLFFL